MHDHTPDLAKIAEALSDLDWLPIDPQRSWLDGTVLLMAVPEYRHVHGVVTDAWFYEFAVATISCDSDFFSLECNGEMCSWDLEDCDWYVVISE